MSQEDDFICSNCGSNIKADFAVGTKNRNHCPKCLYSLHVDNIPGDRKADCNSNMEPIGLTFKKEGLDKYGKEIQGEIMLIHKCGKCGKININRIAGDDDPDEILKIYNKSKDNIELKEKLKKEDINLLDISSSAEIKKQLFGNKKKTML
jgi:DNA-directed RNA polymerase subunit RPC12/RpoP